MKEVIAHKRSIHTYDDNGYIIGMTEIVDRIEFKELKII